MSNTQERIKKRREYLKQKRGAYGKLALLAFLSIPCVLFMVCYILLLIPFAVLFYLLGDTDGKILDRIARPVVVVGQFIGKYSRSAIEGHKQASHLLYVPPVTADTLPAEEVLVRGSQEPAQEQSKRLLRGTQSSKESTEQELLRSSQQE